MSSAQTTSAKRQPRQPVALKPPASLEPARRGKKGRTAAGPAGKGLSTRERLLNVALALFVHRGFRNVTLPDVARAARLSPGAPYQHFKGKDQIFDELSRGFGAALARRIRERLERAPAGAARLESLYDALLAALDAERDLFSLFREAEFALGHKPYDALEPVILAIEEVVAAGKRVSGRTHVLAWAIFSMAYFPAVMGLLWERGGRFERGPIASDLARLTLHGLELRKEAPSLRGRSPRTRASELLTVDTAPRERIVAAAERLFGERGFQTTTISALGRASGLSDSAIFVHFASKEAILSEVVDRIRADLGAAVGRAAAGLADRVAIEQAGLSAFFEFLRSRPGVYRVVREAEFVVPAKGQEYYRSLLAPYASALATAKEAGLIPALNPRVVASALMGLGHWLGLLSVVDAALEPKLTLNIARRLVRHGLAGFDPGGSWPAGNGGGV